MLSVSDSGPAPWRAKSDPYQFHNHVEEENPVIRKFVAAAGRRFALRPGHGGPQVPQVPEYSTPFWSRGWGRIMRYPH